eukprot:g5652.t1
MLMLRQAFHRPLTSNIASFSSVSLDPTIHFDQLCQFMRAVMMEAGVHEKSADAVATCLAWTSLRGVDSHGARLFDRYMQGVRDGGINPQPNISVSQKFPSFLSVDADDGFAQPACALAIDEGIRVAETTGACVVTVQNSNHPGAIGWYTMRAAEKGFIALATTNVGPKMVNHDAIGSSFGTNPISFSFPREEPDPFCLDMSTSKRSWNLVEHARKTGKPLPLDVAVDADGKETVDPHKARYLKPTGSYKGFGLAAVVEMLSCATTGMAHTAETKLMYGPTSDTSEPRRLGQCFIIMRPDGAANVDTKQFCGAVQGITKDVREMRRKDPEIPNLIAGDPELIVRTQRVENGIPLDSAVESSLREWGTLFQVSLDDYLA